MASILYNPDPLIAWYRREKARLEAQIKMCARGMTTGSKKPH
jgi:hypothetical protein